MAATLIIGSQWGDEGKGKIIDFLSAKADYIVRYQGGNNAGHTVINNYGTFPLHLVPSGIFSKATACISNGTVLGLEVLAEEIAMLEKAGIKLNGRLLISPRCHIIMPYHKLLDKLYEQAKGAGKTGTTGRGIGPVYADKVSYQGIRLYDLMNKKQFSDKLKVQLRIKNPILKVFGENPLTQKNVEKMIFKAYSKIKSFIVEPYPVLSKAVKNNKHILFEAAQAVFLDNDWGTYPYVTASSITTGGINAGCGIPVQNITDVIGVVKAYTTRVGEGPFPTELLDKEGAYLQKEGAEFGATTGRPRRCGWFDAELVRFACELNHFTGIAITKLDVLDKLKQIKICTGYTYRGKPVRYYDGDAEFLKKIKPVYKILPGWQQSTKGITQFEKLPPQAQNYIKELEKLIGVKAIYISTGPKREEIIAR